MTPIRASYLVVVVAAWSVSGALADAASLPPPPLSVRCETAMSPVTTDSRDDSFVAPADACSSPADEQRSVWPSPILPYDGSSANAPHVRSRRSGVDFLGSVAAFAHFFAAFDAAATHRLLPHLAHRHRDVPPASIPSF